MASQLLLLLHKPYKCIYLFHPRLIRDDCYYTLLSVDVELPRSLKRSDDGGTDVSCTFWSTTVIAMVSLSVSHNGWRRKGFSSFCFYCCLLLLHVEYELCDVAFSRTLRIPSVAVSSRFSLKPVLIFPIIPAKITFLAWQIWNRELTAGVLKNKTENKPNTRKCEKECFLNRDFLTIFCENSDHVLFCLI